tara:strand:+ start:653 stop:1066 length:414 start_codon:yes stop_codon:yes gene_type:complete
MKNIILLLFVVSCNNPIVSDDTYEPPPTPFEVYMEVEQDNSGYYHITYPQGSTSSYDRVYVKTIPTQRVFWNSPNTFDTYYQQQWFSTPIIQYSTYSSSDSIAQQLFYLYEQFIGDTLTIVGGLSENTWDYLQVIIH